MSDRTEVLSTDHPEAVERALRVLRDGGLVAFPTDTVYGLGALAFEEQAVLRIYEAKGRGMEKAIPILLAGDEWLARVAASPFPSCAARLASRFWPGPLTILVDRHPELPEAISAASTVGVRVPAHPFSLTLLEAAGPMAVTSANRSGAPSTSTASEVLADLEGRFDLLLDGGKTPGGKPSTVVDCTRTPPRILRSGPITLDEILEALA